MSTLRATATAFVLALVIVPDLAAELSVRECIRVAPNGFTHAYEVPNNNQWVTITAVEMNIESPSHLVAAANLYISDAPNPVGEVIHLRFRFEGQATWSKPVRLPPVNSSTIKIFEVLPDVQTGDVELELQLKNNTPLPFRFLRVWLSPLLVDATEATYFSSLGGVPRSLSKSWTDLASFSVGVTGRHIYLGGYVWASLAGGAGSEVEYRFYHLNAISSAAELYRFEDHHEQTPDSRSFNYILKNASAGDIVILQARAKQGGVANAAFLYGVSIPPVSVLEAEADSPVSVPADKATHTLLASSPSFLNSLSLSGFLRPSGNRLTSSSGFGFVVPESQYAGEMNLSFQILKDGMVLFHDAGIVNQSPLPDARFLHDWTGWPGYVDLYPSGMFHMELQAKALCESEDPITVGRRLFQVAIFPSPYDTSNPHACTDSHWSGCPYQCYVPSSIQVIAYSGRTLCN